MTINPIKRHREKKEWNRYLAELNRKQIETLAVYRFMDEQSKKGVIFK